MALFAAPSVALAQPAPNLVIGGFDTPPLMWSPWSQEGVFVEICNLGDADAPANIHATVALSTDDVFDITDNVIGGVTVPGLAAGSCGKSPFTVFGSGEQGARFVVAEVDPHNELAESDELDNTGASAPIGFGLGSELFIAKVEAPTSADGLIEAEVIVCDQSLGPVPSAEVRLYASPDALLEPPAEFPASLDVLLATTAVVLDGNGVCAKVPFTAVAPPWPAGPAYLVATVESSGSGPELVESNNTSDFVSIGLGIGPDLVVQAIDAPAHSEGPFLTTVTVCNQGTDFAPPSDLSLFASPSPPVDPATAPQLGAQAVPALAPSQCADVEVSAVAPPTPGAQTLAALVDPLDAVFELIEDNGQREVGLVFGPGHNLAVTALEMPANVLSTVDAEITVCNRGSTHAPATQVVFVVSRDDIISDPTTQPLSWDTLLSSASVSGLAPRQCETVPVSGTVPMGQSMTFGAIVQDPTGLDAQDDLLTRGPVGTSQAPDFLVTRIGIERSLMPLETRAVIEVCNQGTTAGTPGMMTIAGSPLPLFFSEPYTNVLVGWPSSPALEPGQCDTQRVPLSLRGDPGEYYLAVSVSRYPPIEVRTNNNLTVAGPFGLGEGPNLYVRQVQLPPNANQPFTAQIQVCNDGPRDAPPSQLTLLGSLDETIETPFTNSWSTDVVLGFVDVPQLWAQNCRTLAVDATPPPGPEGPYFVGVVLDEADVVDELVESDNLHIEGPIGFGFGPDLVVENLQAPPSAQGPFDLSVTVCNQGTASAPGVDVVVLASTDRVIDLQGLTNYPVFSQLAPALQPGQCHTLTGQATPPPGPEGAWFLGAAVDPMNNEFELVEREPSVFGPFGFGAGPDLVVTAIDLPSTANGAFEATVTLCNQGTTALGPVPLQLFGSTDLSLELPSETPWTADVLLGTGNVPVLQPGQCAIESVSANSAGATGLHHVAAVANVPVTSELITSNNLRFFGPIGFGEGPNHVVRELSVIRTYELRRGETELEVTICNVGTMRGAGISAALAVSTDDYFPEDLGTVRFETAFGEVNVPPLMAGECDTQRSQIASFIEGAAYIAAGLHHAGAPELRTDDDMMVIGPVGLGTGPNLRVAQVVLPPSADGPFTVSLDVCNEGFTRSDATDVAVYASADPVIETPQTAPWTLDQPLGFGSVPVIEPANCEWVQVQASSVPGASAFYVGAIVDEADGVLELLETDNLTVAGPMGMGSGPDLVVSELDMPASVDGPFEAALTVCNQGTQSAPPSDVELFASADDVLDRQFYTDAPIGAATVPSLFAGQCASVTIPAGTVALGQSDLMVIAHVDPFDGVTELREDNQTRAFGPYGFGAGPNLMISEIRLPQSTQSSLQHEVTVCNVGTAPSPGTNVTTYASADEQISTTPDPTGTLLDYGVGFGPVPALDAGRCATVSLDGPLPMLNGAYFVGAIVDEVGAVDELIESDNLTIEGPIGVGVGPDFVVTYAQIHPAAPGQPESVEAEVCNVGTAPGAPHDVEVYASVSGRLPEPSYLYTQDARLVGSVTPPATLPAGECATLTEPNVFLPPPGPYYLVSVVDSRDLEVELVESNNRTRRGPVGLGMGPNYVVASLEVPRAADGAFRATAEVCNIGFIDPGQATQVSLFASTDAIIETPWQTPWSPDIPIGFATVSAIEAGECKFVDIDAFSPGGAPGAYYVGAVADDGDAVQELLETDNVLVQGRVGFGSGPLLVVESVVPAGAAPAIDLTVTVCNEGTAASPPSNLTVVASADQAIEGAPFYEDMPIAGAPVPSLPAGGCAAVQVIGPSLPYPDGAYYLGAFPDDGDQVEELVEGRPATAFGPFGFGFGADLFVSQVVLPTSSQGPFDAQVTVCNQGSAPAAGTDVTLFASLDRVLDSLTAPGGDLPIGGATTPALLDGACATITVPVSHFGAGLENIGVIVDEQDLEPELLESNNLSWWGPVAFGFGPDLVVRSTTVPPVLDNAQVSATVTVCNDGTDASPASDVEVFAALREGGLDVLYTPGFPDDISYLGGAPVGALAVGACEAVPVDVYGPYFMNGPPAGQAVVVAAVNRFGHVQELAPRNNLTVGGRIGYGFGPELRVASITGPTFASPGQEITAAVRVCNDGRDGTSSTDLRLFASSDDALDTRGLDPEIGVAPVPPVAPSSCVDITAPTFGFGNLAVGAWRLGAQVDPNDVVAELLEGNNSTLGGAVQIATDFCGNGAVDPGEQCDDGNNTSGDGCTAACITEFCGDGVVNLAEVCDDGNSLPYDGCSPACVPQGALLGEVMQISSNQTGAGQTWYSLAFTTPLTNPVVVGHTLSFNGGDPTHLRVRNVSGAGFEWKMEEWDYKDGNHTTETLPFLAMEAGRHVLEDGKDAEAGTVSTTHGWTTVTFSTPFAGTPVLLTGVMSDVDSTAVVVRTRNLSATGFEVRVQEEEAQPAAHAAETVAYVAMEAGTGFVDGAQYEVARTPDAVRHSWYNLSFATGFASAPVFLGNVDTFDGGDTAGLRYRNLTGTSVQVKVEEEKSANSEVGHTTERVSWMVWEAPGAIVAAP